MVEFYILERIIVNKKTTRIVYHYSGLAFKFFSLPFYL